GRPRGVAVRRRGHCAGRRLWPPYGRRDSRPLKRLLPWPMIVTTAHRRIAAAHRQRPPRARRSTLSSPRRKALLRPPNPARERGRRGRLIFALDATMSRQPMWDTACRLQADMFREAAAIGGLDVQLVYYRGLSECRASRWVSQAERLSALMERIDCRGGHTQ